MTGPIRPGALVNMSLLVKLGSIAVHADEATDDGAHGFDVVAMRQLLADPEVVEFLAAMDKQALLPVKRGGAK